MLNLKIKNKTTDVIDVAKRVVKAAMVGRILIPNLTWQEVCKIYSQLGGNRNLSTLTRVKYKQVLDEFFKSASNEISNDEIRSYVDSLQMRSEHRVVTINKRLTILKSFFSWAVKNKYVDFNPTFGVKQLKGAGESQIVPISVGLVESLYSKARKDDQVYLQDVLMFEVLYGSNILMKDLCDLKITDINISEPSIEIKNSGNSKKVKIAARVAKHLEQYIAQINPSSRFLFSNRKGGRINHKYAYERIQRIRNILFSEVHGQPPPFRVRTKDLIICEDHASTHNSFCPTKSMELLKSVYEAAHPKK